MISLQQLQRRLEQEVLAFQWRCQAVNSALLISGTALPEEIMISATLMESPSQAVPLPERPNARALGDRSAARLICNELTPNTPPPSMDRD